MKTPRVNDFDPTAKLPELGSPLDNFPPIQKPQAKQGTNQAIPAVRDVRSVPPVRPVRRMKIRHPFDLYQDQVETLRQLALEERKRGEQGSMSAMVREAIDTYIAKKKMEEKE